MTIATILKEKKVNKDNLLKNYNFKNKKLPVWLIKLNTELTDSVLLDALKILPGNFLISWNIDNTDNNENIAFIDNNIDNLGFDFIVCDDCEDDLMWYMRKWSIPIIFDNHHLSNLLSEFDAWQTSWNAFIFKNNALCDIYYAIIRYLENYKFPYDNKALVKNVLDI